MYPTLTAATFLHHLIETGKSSMSCSAIVARPLSKRNALCFSGYFYECPSVERATKFSYFQSAGPLAEKNPVKYEQKLVFVDSISSDEHTVKESLMHTGHA